MSYDEFVNRWLVVGTDSKFDKSVSDDADRDGLSRRTKQGQKGIGRLSSANLGPLLLIVSKRKNEDFVAALIDWRIFENPYLVLSDIEIPVTTFSEKEALFDQLPELFDRLTDNIWGNLNDEKRTSRLKLAWDTYDKVVTNEDLFSKKPSELIAETIVSARFEERHLAPWHVWAGASDNGTALIVSNLNFDLRALLPSAEIDRSTKRTRKDFISTLYAFTDPYVSSDASELNSIDPEFYYKVKTWEAEVSTDVVEGDMISVSREITEQMEHVLSGNIDEFGVFRGQVKAFGEWIQLSQNYEIFPPADLDIPKGPTTFVGPFSLHLATFEQVRNNSTLSDSDFARFSELDDHSGFLIFRDGLRVLPYGRESNDFFEIETRRSINAGREFWNKRRMFGRVALSRNLNPNLRDKAGREGFIDNRAAKVLRALVMNILIRAAYEYFGSNSSFRNELLKDIQAQNEKERAERERKELSKKTGKKFRFRLRKNLPLLVKLYDRTEFLVANMRIEDVHGLDEIQVVISDLTMQLAELRVPGAPANLGSVEEDYRQFRTIFAGMLDRIKALEEMRAEAIERISPAKPEEIAQKQLSSHASRLQARLRSWRKSIDEVQGSEVSRVAKLFEERNKAFHQDAMPLVEQVRMGRIGLDDALEQMKLLHEKLDTENEDTFQSYLDALEVMSENINIELIARQGTADNIALRDDLNRLNQVAQLGITVEVLGHEINSSERMIREGIRQIRQAGDVSGTQLIETGFNALSQQIEFLSPLKVSGTRTRRDITGSEILEYMQGFFDTVTRGREITIDASDEFKRFSVNEQPSRLLPVFINLVNNSVYWLVTSKTLQPKVFLSVQDQKIIISDNGPGIDPVDQESLFKMFFTRKENDGRGIGLYLCRVNLMAGGHSIQFATDRKFQKLEGANFVIDFKGANFG
jgi:signal transduction histidine kinase